MKTNPGRLVKSHRIARNGPILNMLIGLFLGGASSAGAAPVDPDVVAQDRPAAGASGTAVVKQRRNDRGDWADPVTVAPAGTMYQTCFSRTINGPYSYLVCLPPGYDINPAKRYPVIYWLHGGGGSQRTGEYFVKDYSEAIKSGGAPEAILILVNGVGSSLFCDSFDGQKPVESVIVNDLIPHVDATYRTFGTRAMRAIEGFSMGGFGALHLAFKFPETFGSMTALAHAPIRPNSGWEKVDRVYREGPLAGNVDYFNANDPFQLVEKNAGAIRDGMSLRFIVGDKDQSGTQARTKEFYEKTQKLGMKSTLTIVPGVAHSCPNLYDVLGGPLFGYYMRYFASVAARETSGSAPKYAGLSPAPFGKGIFAHVRAGGKIRASEETIRNWARNPYVAGTQLSYCWSELEVREGEYRWDIIEKDMEIWARHGKKCWLEVSTAFRWSQSGELGVPAWVYRKGVPKIQAAGSAPYPVYWNPLYLELWGKFVRAFGRKFDGDPRVEWVAVGGHTTGTEPRLSSKENDLVMDRWEKAGFDGFKPQGIYLQQAIKPIYKMFRDAFQRTQVSSTFISTGEFSEVMNRYGAELGFLLTSNGFGTKAATRPGRENIRRRRELGGAKIAYAEFGPSGRDSRFLDEKFEKPKGVSVKEMRDSTHVAKLMDIYQGAIGDDTDPQRRPFSRLSYLPLAERAANVETEAEWTAALKWAWERLEK